MSQYAQDHHMGGLGQELFDNSIIGQEPPIMNIVNNNSKPQTGSQGRVVTPVQPPQYYPNYSRRREQWGTRNNRGNRNSRNNHREFRRETNEEREQRFEINRDNLRRAMQSPRQKYWDEKPRKYREKIEQPPVQEINKTSNVIEATLEQAKEDQARKIEVEDYKEPMAIKNEVPQAIAVSAEKKDSKIVQIGMAPIIEALNESSVLFDPVQDAFNNQTQSAPVLIGEPITAEVEDNEDLHELEIVDIKVSLKSKTIAQCRSLKKVNRISSNHRSIEKVVSPRKQIQIQQQQTSETQQALNRIKLEQRYKFSRMEIEFRCGNNTKEVKVRAVRLNALRIDVNIDFDSQKRPIAHSIIPPNQLETYIRFLEISHSYKRQYRSGYIYSQSQLCEIRISPEDLMSGFHSNLLHVSTIEMRCFCETRNLVPISSTLSAVLSCRSCSKPMEVLICRLQIIAD